MRIAHKYNPGLWKRETEPPVIDARYQDEIDASLRKAERAWKHAQRETERLERKYTSEPTRENAARYNEARCRVLVRLDELRRIEELMRPVQTSPARSVRIVNKGRAL